MRKTVAFLLVGVFAACSGRKSTTDENSTGQASSAANLATGNTYQQDRLFLQQYHPNLVELRSGATRAIICPDYQGRVMTSTADGQASYGWLNYELIRSRKKLPHMNAFGGEDRFWLGPEGGQYALFFRKGEPFDSEHWQTPPVIDSEPFTLDDVTPTSATFSRKVSLTNYSGMQFDIGVKRVVTLLSGVEINRLLHVQGDSLKAVGIRSDNIITNLGTKAWTTQTGMPSIWVLSMMNASPQTTIIVPYRAGAGQPINDAYFGKVPADRLVLGKTAAFFKADAKYRSKIGVSSSRATNWVGSYNPITQTLTLVTFDFDPRTRQYVNSAWEQQKDPYGGDVINAYNDGPMKPGQPQMGQFYELESSSPAANLLPGANRQHRHTVLHVQGDEQVLNKLAKNLLQTDLSASKTSTSN